MMVLRLGALAVVCEMSVMLFECWKKWIWNIGVLYAREAIMSATFRCPTQPERRRQKVSGRSEAVEMPGSGVSQGPGGAFQSRIAENYVRPNDALTLIHVLASGLSVIRRCYEKHQQAKRGTLVQGFEDRSPTQDLL